MPSFRVTSPDGTVYQLTPPEGASDADIQAQLAHITGAPTTSAGPVPGPHRADLAGNISTVPQGQTAQQRTARQRIADLQSQTGQAQAAQMEANAKGEFAGTLAAAAPAAVAAPFTGGGSIAALAGSMGTMALAGAGGGIAREAVKGAFGSTDLPMTGRALAKTLSLDAVLGGAAEGLGQGVGYVGAKLLPRLVQKAAAQAEQGRNLLDTAFVQTRQKIYDLARAAGNPGVQTGTEIGQALHDLRQLPVGRGATGKRFGGLSPKAAEIVGDFETDLATAGGSISTVQPLDFMVQFVGKLSEAAYHEPGLSTEEAKVLQGLTAKLKDKVRATLKTAVGPEAVDLFESANQLKKTQLSNDTLMRVAQTALRSTMARTVAGFGLGGYYGYRKGGLQGAAEGAAAGAGAAFVPQAATWALQYAMNHPQAALAVKNAIRLASTGQGEAATVQMERAFATAQIRQHLREYLSGQAKMADTKAGQGLEAEAINSATALNQ